MHSRHLLHSLVCVLLVTGVTGCHLFGGKRAYYGRHLPCQFSAQTHPLQLVQHVNQNVARLQSWRAANVSISTRGPGGAPVSLSAIIAVEAPRNFRLVASSIAGNEVDLGSNAGQFWFWSRRMPEHQKYVLTARHDAVETAAQKLPIPFAPDWLLEVLGVTSLDEENLQTEPATGPQRMHLVSFRQSPQGETLKKVTVLDTCHGLVLEHVLFDARGRMQARAVISGHRPDPVTGIVLPGQIDIDWPSAQMTLNLRLGPIDVNPKLPPRTWEVPNIPNAPVMDLSGPP